MKAELQNISKNLSLPSLFWFPAMLVFALAGASLCLPEKFSSSVNHLNRLIFEHFGSFYLWFVWLSLLAFVGIGLSPLGSIRLGGAESKPEHGFWSWFAMLFCAGMGTGFMFWGAAEPLYHYMNPPLSDPLSALQLKRTAFQYTFFHWGLHPWAIYGMTALAIGFFGFNLKKGFYFSAFLTDREHRGLQLWRFCIDVTTILAIIFGIAATFGMAILQLEGAAKHYLHWQSSIQLTLTLLLGVCICFLASALNGLEKGIKFLSVLNLILCTIMLVTLFAYGPTQSSLPDLTESLSGYFTHLIPMSFGEGHFHQQTWVADWTIKYWSWWIAWAPFVGMFIAYISKGRSIRELVFGIMIAPTLFSCLWFIVFGEAAITLQDTTRFMGDHLHFPQVNGVLFALMNQITQAPWLSILGVSLIAINFINSADSATYTLACLSNRDLDRSPSAFLQIVWGLILTILAGLLLLTGGIQILQEITLITVLPFTLLLVMIFTYLLVKLLQAKYAKGKTHNLSQKP